ncbi:MAG: segregation and condensation protein B [Candidatus Parcubacteria bacterium]|nr:SMC-Scp complex subunit ScpB [Patescibacteria group bacterium]BCX16174.1 MAG: segregation and condensation protein B [Candidatus Parcubacteria bacterium]
MSENNQLYNFSSNNNLLAALEAFLFLYGEPIEKEKLCKIFGVSLQEIKEALNQLAEETKQEKRGIMLVEKEETYALVTKPQFAPLLEAFVKENLKEELTPAALETLSIIAYFGPISRAQIDYIRGVNSSFTLRNLLIRGLIERKTKGNFYLYQPSFELLKYLGLSKIEELPNFQKFSEIKNSLFQEENQRENKN